MQFPTIFTPISVGDLYGDEAVLSFEGIEPAEPFRSELYVTDTSDDPTAAFAYADDATNGIDPAAVTKGTAAVIAEATFTVASGVAGETLISITQPDVILVGDDSFFGYTPKLAAGDAVIEIAHELPEIKFILKEGLSEAESYTVLADGTKIAVLLSDTNDAIYTYDGNAFLYSEKLGGYAMIIADDIDSDGLTRGITVSADESHEIVYDGDITGDGNVTAGDAALVSHILHSPNGDWSDLMRLRADVTDGETYITTADALWILKESVGLN